VALGAIHMRHRASEGRRGGRARASEEGAGPKPRPLGLAGRCPGCRREGGCTPGQVVLGECRCARDGVDWGRMGIRHGASKGAAGRGKAGACHGPGPGHATGCLVRV
jgi:hypothetical protein